MPLIKANGIDIFCEDTGPAGAEPVLLISGVGMQLTRWDAGFTQALAARGWRVIRIDNRDIGLSGKLDEAGLPDHRAVLAAKAAGAPSPAPYTLDDMAADAAGALDALGIGAAHVIGASMGGMIVQLMAINHPEKVLSMTSIMSTTGNPALPQATPEAMAVLTAPRPDPAADLEAYLDQSVISAGVIGSPAHPETPEAIRARAAADVDRSYYPAGFARQYAAILAAPDRRTKLAALDVPALVVHGTDDPLVRVEGGRDTAAAIPGAEMLEIAGMGHNIPDALIDPIIDAFEAVARRRAAA